MNILPIELVNIILSYDGSIIKERNGKYMKQISKMDKRYEILLKIPIKDLVFFSKYSDFSHVNVWFLDRIFCLTMIGYPNTICYILYKNGYTMDETRHLCK